MPEYLFGRAFWPGAESFASVTYTCSHGITPGVAVLTINPQAAPYALSGDLVLDDGAVRITIPRCKVDKVSARVDGNGEVWDLVILDRRWRWRELGGISGTYNQVDPSGQVIPWTERTPKQLAELCLQAMGETRYRINLPFVAVNPPVQWDHTPPAQALSSLAESLGCRVIYRLDDDSILIAPQGEGEGLPNGSIQSDGPSLDSPERPDQIVVYGQPIRYQARFALEAVGEDWDGSIRPIDELTYAPSAPVAAVAQAFTITPATVTVGNTFTLALDTELVGQDFTFTATAATVANVTAGLAALVNAGNAGGLPWFAVDNGTNVTVSGSLDGAGFKATTSAAVAAGSGTPTLTWTLLTLGRMAGQKPWTYSGPPTFAAVQATDRLTKIQATELAKKSVFRYFRVRAVDPSDTRKPLQIPQYMGKIERREQIVLHQTRAEQITPQPQDDRILDDQGRKRIVIFYDGHTRDMPARIIGAYSHGTSGIGINTSATSDVAIPFSIDAERGLVVFSQYVAFSPVMGSVRPATLVLETGCNVRDFTTNALVTIEKALDLPPPKFNTPPLYIHRDDVQYTVIGEYDDKHRLTGAHELLPTVPPGRRGGAPAIPPTANIKLSYYLQAYAAQYLNVTAQERLYNGLVGIWLDGAIQQVTWDIGDNGVETRASRNNEHSRYIPPYPVRKRNEILDPLMKGKDGANPPMGVINRLHEPPGSQSSGGVMR